ncbi:MAG: PepSY-associated TM helix domain-containing protein [Planctomycetales bacterium]|nr:PepSY-associated TM helix domain-containing protein [Planctomycetales bacterium]
MPQDISEGDSEPTQPKKRSTNSRGKRINRFLASWSRWIHIYLSMVSLVAILFFSVTGITLNHPDWFFAESTAQSTGTLNAAWLNNGNGPPPDWDEPDDSYAVSKLEVAEHLRATHSLRGTVSDFLVFEDECEVTFQGPGYAAIAKLSRETGDYTLDVTSNDLVTVMNDLHKGRHTNASWSWVIDLSAVVGTLVAISGFILIFFLRLKRTTGIVTAAVGALLMWWMYTLAIA